MYDPIPAQGKYLENLLVSQIMMLMPLLRILEISINEVVCYRIKYIATTTLPASDRGSSEVIVMLCLVLLSGMMDLNLGGHWNVNYTMAIR